MSWIIAFDDVFELIMTKLNHKWLLMSKVKYYFTIRRLLLAEGKTKQILKHQKTLVYKLYNKKILPWEISIFSPFIFPYFFPFVWYIASYPVEASVFLFFGIFTISLVSVCYIDLSLFCRFKRNLNIRRLFCLDVSDHFDTYSPLG